ncbi:MAG: hypothetical protein VX930_13405, partial [Pseudomonadota bacterium]|nr:hypothetical protein [Pseudomonadota bacterium]
AGSCAGGPVIPHCACSAGCGQCEPTRSPWAAAEGKMAMRASAMAADAESIGSSVSVSELQVYELPCR